MGNFTSLSKTVFGKSEMNLASGRYTILALCHEPFIINSETKYAEKLVLGIIEGNEVVQLTLANLNTFINTRCGLMAFENGKFKENVFHDGEFCQNLSTRAQAARVTLATFFSKVWPSVCKAPLDVKATPFEAKSRKGRSYIAARYTVNRIPNTTVNITEERFKELCKMNGIHDAVGFDGSLTVTQGETAQVEAIFRQEAPAQAPAQAPDSMPF